MILMYYYATYTRVWIIIYFKSKFYNIIEQYLVQKI